MNKSLLSTIEPSIIQNRVIEIWKKIFLIKELEKEHRIKRPEEKSYQQPFTVTKKRVGRNGPCPCGSGKKYKYCCMN